MINGIKKDLYEMIWQENAAFIKLKHFYEPEYLSFLTDFCANYSFTNEVSMDLDFSSYTNTQ